MYVCMPLVYWKTTFLHSAFRCHSGCLMYICWCIHVLLSNCTACMTVLYLCRWTSWTVWWAAVCQPYHQARHSVQCRAPCSRSSPSLTATACGSRSAEGWHPEPCHPGGEPEESENTLQLWWQEAQQSQHFNLKVLHFRFDELNSSATTKGVTVSILSVWKVHHRWVKCNEWFWCEKHFP